MSQLEVPFVDLVVHVQREDKECLEKQFGRVEDVRNHTTFHLAENKP